MKEFFKSFAESSSKVQLFTVVMTLFFLFYCACNVSAETKREGNNFISTSTSAKKDTLVTTYTFQVGTEKYPIIIKYADIIHYSMDGDSLTSAEITKAYELFTEDIDSLGFKALQREDLENYSWCY